MEIPVFMVFLLSMSCLVALPIVLVAFFAARKRSKQSELTPTEEDRLRRIWDGLQRMEQRVDNLETILEPRRNPNGFTDHTDATTGSPRGTSRS